MQSAIDAGSSRETGRPGPPGAGITRRESEVLRLLVDRYGNAEIAARLGISKRTVESHVGALLHKLGALNRAELIGKFSVPAGAAVRAEPARAPVAGSITVASRDLRRRAAQMREQSRRRRTSSIEAIDQTRDALARAQLLVDPANNS